MRFTTKSIYWIKIYKFIIVSKCFSVTDLCNENPYCTIDMRFTHSASHPLYNVIFTKNQNPFFYYMQFI
ncbi:hypothetical protein DWZ56_22470 [Lachnotalea sp. AF33-28]|nr:hypothetical protein DWZ56_22470 [Lachnotalea sp. AF33-28]